MGTKIEYPLAAPTNSLLSSPPSPPSPYNLLNFAMDNRASTSTTSTTSIQFDMDTIKRTMQIQDDIFRHQVKELHRLYSVQRRLMLEMKSVERSGSCSGKTREIDGCEDEEEERVELTLSIGSSNNNNNHKRIYRGGEIDSGPNTPPTMSNNTTATTTTTTTSSTFDQQEKKMPHWLLGLSINRS